MAEWERYGYDRVRGFFQKFGDFGGYGYEVKLRTIKGFASFI